ncbi:MAG TPA: hypothetical protein VFA09_07180 [Ktedonobacteraceae bacterium]|nr:hypothetical protein [Ktedonobacteraceae bacterium]
MEKLTLPENRGYLIAIIGGIEALTAFLLMPYITLVYPGSGGVSFALSAFSDGGLIWVELILALAAIIIPAVLIFRSNPFGLSGTPLETQVRIGIYSLIGIGALGLLAQLIVALNGGDFTINGQTLNALNSGSNSSLNINYSTGFWFFLLSMLAVAVGGGIAFKEKIGLPSSAHTWTPSTQYPPYQQDVPPAPDYVAYPQQWQQGQPGQQPPLQYPAYDPQQWQPTQQQQPPPPPYQGYNPQQWQPTQQQQPNPQQWQPTQPPQPPQTNPQYPQQKPPQQP